MDRLPFSGLRLVHRREAVDILAGVDPTGTDVIIKRFAVERCGRDPLAATRFRREVSIHQKLHHPGIARCLGAGEDWLALERLQSGLDEPSRRSAFREAGAVRTLLHDLGEILAYLHARGIVHADLKPAHVMFRADRPVIIDFGIAALGSRDLVAGAELAGSPRWMAPEVVAGGLPSPASDVWATCAIACWLLNGAPDSDEDAQAILERRSKDGDTTDMRLRPPEGIDRSLAAVLMAGLGPHEKRPSAARIVQLISRTTAE